jgi:hypothetical protein
MRGDGAAMASSTTAVDETWSERRGRGIGVDEEARASSTMV